MNWESSHGRLLLSCWEYIDRNNKIDPGPHLGLMTRYLLLFDSYSLVFGPLSNERLGPSFIYTAGPHQRSFLGYCLRFETSHFVASYNLHGHGGGIWPRFHTGTESDIYIATDSQSISKSWCRAPSAAHDQIFITLWQLRSSFCGAPSLTRGRVCLLYMLLALASGVTMEVFESKSKSKSKLCYDRRSVGHSVLVPSTHLGLTTRFHCCQRVAGLLTWGALSDERKGLKFTIAAGSCQHSHSWVRVPWVS
jgi:hypothetical protein